MELKESKYRENLELAYKLFPILGGPLGNTLRQKVVGYGESVAAEGRILEAFALTNLPVEVGLAKMGHYIREIMRVQGFAQTDFVQHMTDFDNYESKTEHYFRGKEGKGGERYVVDHRFDVMNSSNSKIMLIEEKGGLKN
jgi:hypothetical protein